MTDANFHSVYQFCRQAAVLRLRTHLVGLIIVYRVSPSHSFDMAAMLQGAATLSHTQQLALLSAFIIGFGVKIPIFPLQRKAALGVLVQIAGKADQPLRPELVEARASGH